MTKKNKVSGYSKGDQMTVCLGKVGVDSGQLVLCDPCYIDSQWRGDSDPVETHKVYRSLADGTLWQYRYGRDEGHTAGGDKINPFPGDYDSAIPGLGMGANKAIAKGLLTPTEYEDAAAAAKRGEFSYAGIQSSYGGIGGIAAQLNYKLGHAGVGVAFATAHGNGTYGVYADCTYDGRRWVQDRVWVDLTGNYVMTYSTPQDGITRYKQMLVLKLENLVEGKERTALGKAAKAVADLIEGSKVKVPRG